MNVRNDLALAYHMGYDDALAKRKPDASKAQVLAPYDLAEENSKLRELCADLYAEMITYSSAPNYNASVWTQKLREFGIEVP